MKTLTHPFARTALAACLAFSAGTALAAPLGVSIGAKVDAAGVALTDTAITGKIKTRIATDAALNNSSISVNTNGGIAVLTGTVPSIEAKLAAEKLVTGTEGVTRVDNQLVIAANPPSALQKAEGKVESGLVKAETKVEAAASTTGRVVSDSWITTKVKTQLLADTLTEGTKMTVKTKKKVVYLSGWADSQAEKDQAIALAGQIEGVKRVNASRLKVKADASASVN